MVQERGREQSSNVSSSSSRLRHRKEGKVTGASMQVDGTGDEINIEPERTLVGHSNAFLDCFLES